MRAKYIQNFPTPLLDDLVGGRWLPIVGAGFSRNAVLPTGKTMLLWRDLGDKLGRELEDYAPSTPLDAISAYEHDFGRPKLVERLYEMLLVDEARPGNAHKAFCSIPFDLVCTTNLDFLLERQYELLPRHCTPLVDEDQLSVNVKDTSVALLKLHADLHHPARMVVTETDYDLFLDRYPLLATYLANLLITRTAVLIGYSLDDPDFRQVWQVVGERLGQSRGMAYAIGVGVNPTDARRFARRGIRVINLPGAKSRYSEVLAGAFSELGDYWRERVIPASQIKEETSLRELSLPPEASTRLCFFAVPLSSLWFYRERVFPIAREYGFVPMSLDDVASPGDTVFAKMEALVQRAQLLVVDASMPDTLFEMGIAQVQLGWERILVIGPIMGPLPFDFDIGKSHVIVQPNMTTAYPKEFLLQVEQWFAAAAERFRPMLFDEPMRLLHIKEYRAALIAAISLLEDVLRHSLKMPSTVPSRKTTLISMLEDAHRQGLLGDVPVARVLDWLRTRNMVVHSQVPVQKSTAEEIVNGVLRIARAAQ